MNKYRAESGLDWGAEIENLIVDELNNRERNEIEENELVEILFQRREIQTLLAQFVESCQQFHEWKKHSTLNDPKYQKELGIDVFDPSSPTPREKLGDLIKGVVDGTYHWLGRTDAHKRLSTYTTTNNDGREKNMIRKIDDFSDLK